MYESYAWPGAYSFKDEIKMLINWLKAPFRSLNKKIKEIENTNLR